MRNRTVRVFALATALVVGGTALSAPAVAAPSHGYVQGAGAVNDDWGDEGEFSRSAYSIGWAVGLWQTVLYADGYLEMGDIDCQFGPNTEKATMRWQLDHGVGVDGRAGPQTLSRADNKLEYVNSTWVRYHGNRYDVILLRHESNNGRYSFTNRDGNIVPANYNGANCA
ncbi:peptidoglycan-binding protein [Micromonospora sp. HM5-17]|jgi:peptidoglycan hydrolase-like protein with peptidoglycan-binding domain|uniref:peptidoglycan-binding domain-containing protein n=1 Tax=Micromonospora sp. HM5-17 TaxID=2487710 RepID=UPI000F4AAA5F|nr:peptidoglycan-binding protein [Micromonospora sp. HM5-17]ROT31915.1 peptidoglycan-binding protein [Micromonospora sp. HM5-17]